MELTRKLKIAMMDTKITQVELAKRTSQSQANLSRKMISDNYNIKEYKRLVEALGCKLEISIILPNGNKL